MNDEDPISRLVRMYKQSLLAAGTYQELAGAYRPSGIPFPEVEDVQRRLQPALEKEFAVYDRYLHEGYSPADALQKLINSFPERP
jgi:hypothetical protein